MSTASRVNNQVLCGRHHRHRLVPRSSMPSSTFTPRPRSGYFGLGLDHRNAFLRFIFDLIGRHTTTIRPSIHQSTRDSRDKRDIYFYSYFYFFFGSSSPPDSFGFLSSFFLSVSPPSGAVTALGASSGLSRPPLYCGRSVRYCTFGGS